MFQKADKTPDGMLTYKECEKLIEQFNIKLDSDDLKEVDSEVKAQEDEKRGRKGGRRSVGGGSKKGEKGGRKGARRGQKGRGKAGQEGQDHHPVNGHDFSPEVASSHAQDSARSVH